MLFLSRQLSHFQEINESSVLPSEVSEVISATDLENTIEEDFEETDNVCSRVNRILYFYVKYFRLNVMSANNKLLV